MLALLGSMCSGAFLRVVIVHYEIRVNDSRYSAE